MYLQPCRKPVCGGAGETRAFAQFREPAGRVAYGGQDLHRFVEDADAAMLSHVTILTFQILRRNQHGANDD